MSTASDSGGIDPVESGIDFSRAVALTGLPAW